jgi:hypothetical protein
MGGFVVGAIVAAGTVALATELAHGRTFRDVVRRPISECWPRSMVAAGGAAGALFGFNLASGNLRGRRRHCSRNIQTS